MMVFETKQLMDPYLEADDDDAEIILNYFRVTLGAIITKTHSIIF
jgi:hypothetical protein